MGPVVMASRTRRTEEGATMSIEKNAPAAGGDAGLTSGLHSNSTRAQQRRLLERLRIGSVNTLEARRELDVLHPAGRVQELREAGHPISTVWSHEFSDCGRRHRVARYVLRSAPRFGANSGHGEDDGQSRAANDVA